MIHDNQPSNKSNNRTFQDVLQARVSRRNVLLRGMTLSAAGFVTAVAGNKALVQTAKAATSISDPSSRFGGGTAIAEGPEGGRREGREGREGGREEGRGDDGEFQQLLGFTPVAVADGNGPMPVVSADYEYQVLIPWGTPIQPGGPAYNGDPNTRPTAEEQAEQIGIGHDGMWFFPFGDEGGEEGFGNSSHGMLAINHEFGNNNHVLGKGAPENLEDVRLSQHAHGVSVVEIKKSNREWQVVGSPRSRRIHVNTPVTFSGPVANSNLLKTPANNAPKGTVNNCSYGKTPWGTYLTCEENFNGYFGYTDANYQFTEAQERYGFLENGFGYGWHLFDDRFDLSNPSYKNEENRFGWVVEIDPMDASQTPVKRTALGRFKHEGAELVVGRGNRVVVYMGDDQRFDYIYKFVSFADYRRMLRWGFHPLDYGRLYVAKFNDNGTGDWLELSIRNPVLRRAGFKGQDEVLTYARLAADALGATKMDRPEWITAAPDEQMYCSLTNNSRRTEADAANPLAPNPDGHIIRWKDSNQYTGRNFTWDIFVIAEDTHGTEATFSDPDGLWADPDGRLFIETDGGQKDGLNNQLLVADTRTGEIRRLLTGVNEDEVTGLTITPDRRTLFCNLQHPGDGDPAETSFPAAPGSGLIPRDATLVVTRKDGGIVGA